ncbi:MAG TPA: DUF5691 domain-containing protein, partial [Ktedonobacterales bacterium]|nr:DUF5691 domain-containing protein [Ktedonobacterales bacterium]
DSPVDALLGALTDIEAEQRLLLQAGAWAVYHLAGTQPQQGITLPPQAEPETLPSCSPTSANLIRTICSENRDVLLAEALDLLRVAGQRLPFELLPIVLAEAQRHKDLRPRILHVVGERGRWLSQFNPGWSWVAAPLDDGDSLPPYAETIWNEGPIEQRCEMLRRMRLIDPAKGREWLQGVWKSERADQRYSLLSAFGARHEADDIPFLENAAQDRVEKVRDQVTELLAHIPESALAERMRQRAATMLHVKHDDATGKIVLDVTPPQSLSEQEKTAWKQDGMDVDPPKNIGKRTWWLTQAVAHVPPTFWEGHLGLPVAELIASAEATDYASVILEGWAEAAWRFRSPSWALPLWEWWQQVDVGKQLYAVEAHDRETMFIRIATIIPESEREPLAMRMLAIPDQQEIVWKYLTTALPRPWGHDFGMRYLEIVRAHIEAMAQDADKNFDDTHHLLTNTCEFAAKALPSSCFATASEPLIIPEDLVIPHQWMVNRLRETVDQFSQTIQLRQRLHEEIQ